MAAASRFNLFTIPVHRAFADALAAGLMRQHGGDPLGLARGMVLLPNNRAVTAVRDAFVRLAGGAVLLPRLVALGEGNLDAAAGAALDRIDTEPVPPVIDPVQRRLLLAQMIRDENPDGVATLGEAVRLADSLARALDALAFEERGFADLLALQEEEGFALAQHWDVAFHLFTKLSVLWPAALAERGLADRAEVRNLLLNRTAARWTAHGLPTQWLCAAGITTSAPAVARLLGTIGTAKGGSVVFPHLDLAMADDIWAMLGPDPRKRIGDDDIPLETHAQYHLKLLLDRMGSGRGEVQVWPDGSAADGPESRASFISAMLAPAEATKAWPRAEPKPHRLTNVAVLACATPAEEAMAIALILRETLETPARTAALVTPDRAIAQRVVGHLSRWGISIDDSAGTPLPQTPPGALLLAVAQAAGARFAPVELLALLNHPLVRAGEDERRGWLDRVRQLDLALRGPRPPGGLDGVSEALRAAIRAMEADRERRNDARLAELAVLAEWWSGVAAQLAPLDTTEKLPFPVLLDRVQAVLAALAGDGVWSGAAGRALAERLQLLITHAGALAATPLPLAELAGVLDAMLADVAVRPPQGGHPRLFIWGLIEGRLQRADRMILAGLNEGQWPQPPSPDPWLAPGIRRKLGLPGLERQIGLASHDFASALGAAEVILTRAKREGTAPTIPSRLLLRIEAYAGKAAPGPSIHGALAAALDAARGHSRGEQPAPAPDRRFRKQAISASQLDTLLADPFAWYAQAILGLRKLDALDSAPTSMWRGTLVHDLLERWLKEDGHDLGNLLARAEARFAEPDIGPLLRAIWAPRLFAALQWAGETIIAQRADGRVPLVAAAETRAAVEIDGISLSGKADRIDRLADGTLAIVDYKSGGKVSKVAVNAGFTLQLALLGLIAEHGGWAAAHGRVSRFEYWRLNKSASGDGFGWIETPFYTRPPKGVQADSYIDLARERLRFAAQWLTGDAPFTAKLHPEYAPYADYDQLMRLEEWYGVIDTEAGA